MDVWDLAKGGRPFDGCVGAGKGKGGIGEKKREDVSDGCK